MPSPCWWADLEDQRLLNRVPTARPEWVITQTGERVPAPWFQWDSDHWQFRCLLCWSWCPNDNHCKTDQHTTKYQWKAKQYIQQFRRVEANREFDYGDPWGYQRQYHIGRFADRHRQGGPPPAPPPGPPPPGMEEPPAPGPPPPPGMEAAPGLEPMPAIQDAEGELSSGSPAEADTRWQDDIQELKDQIRELKGTIAEMQGSVDELIHLVRRLAGVTDSDLEEEAPAVRVQ